MPDIDGDKPPKKKFKAYPSGFFHIDIAEVQTAEGKLLVAIDRTRKVAFVQLVEKANRVTASAFLVALANAVPYRIHTVLTDNGLQFRLPLRYADRPTAHFVPRMFKMRCRENGIEHCFTKINHPGTNGQVERMSRTIKERAVRQRLQFRAPSEDSQMPHAIRSHLPRLAKRARTLHLKPAPSNAGISRQRTAEITVRMEPGREAGAAADRVQVPPHCLASWIVLLHMHLNRKARIGSLLP